MRTEVARRRWLPVRRGLALGAVGVVGTLLWLACLAPTQVRLELTTDYCAHAPSIAINVGLSRGALLEQYKMRTATQTRNCAQNDSLGTLVFTPGAAGSKGLVFVTVRAAFDGKSPLDCLPENNFAGCVVARRSFRYATGTPLELPVRILAECIDEPCTSTNQVGLTCSTGRTCVSEATTCQANETCVLGDGGPERSDASSRLDSGDGASSDGGSHITTGLCESGDIVQCGLDPLAPLCKVDDGTHCCANGSKAGNGTCTSIIECQGPERQQFCCTDSAQCLDKGQVCCNSGNSGGIITFHCDLPNNCVGKTTLCGSGVQGVSRCPAGSVCSSSKGETPFFTCGPPP